MYFDRKHANYFKAGRTGRISWSRLGVEEWLTALNTAYAGDPEGYDSLIVTVAFLHRRYGKKAVLYSHRCLAILQFMEAHKAELAKDGYVECNSKGHALSYELLGALAKLPFSREGFSYKRVRNYLTSCAKPS